MNDRERQGFEFARSIIGRQLRLLRFRLAAWGIERDDAEAEAWHAVLRACDLIDDRATQAERGAFVRRAVRGDLLNLIATASRQRRAGEQLCLRLDEPMGEDGSTLADVVGDFADPGEAIDAQRLIDLVREQARDERERQIVMRFEADETQDEIAARWGVTRQAVAQAERKFFARVRAVA